MHFEKKYSRPYLEEDGSIDSVATEEFRHKKSAEASEYEDQTNESAYLGMKPDAYKIQFKPMIRGSLQVNKHGDARREPVKKVALLCRALHK